MRAAGGTMRALRLVEPGRPVEERVLERPEPGPGEVLVRVRAAGICHSDAHYRAGVSATAPPPVTLGHEVAGTVERTGPGVGGALEGERVCLHYLDTCGACGACVEGEEQFCDEAAMLGKSRNGGWAEFVRVPARNAVPVPEGISFPHAAVMMCSTATSQHALNRARMEAGDRVAVFGAGGLGLSAVQLALARGAGRVLAVDVRDAPLEAADELGATPVLGDGADASERVLEASGGRGVDVALELAGLPATARAALESLAPGGRLALAGIFADPVEVRPYREIICTEAEVVGVSDHLLPEIREVLAWAARGELRLDPVVRRAVPLRAEPVNEVLDRLETFEATGRTVIAPETDEAPDT